MGAAANVAVRLGEPDYFQFQDSFIKLTNQTHLRTPLLPGHRGGGRSSPVTVCGVLAVDGGLDDDE